MLKSVQWRVFVSAALGQIMLFVDGMNGVIGHTETIQWLYVLIGSKVTRRLISVCDDQSPSEI